MPINGLRILSVDVPFTGEEVSVTVSLSSET
jgi:hypothetical protein